MSIGALATFVLGAIAALALLTLAVAWAIKTAGAVLLDWIFRHY